MRIFLVAIISLLFAINAIGQQMPIDSGFRNKAEAKNLMVKGKREGKWVEYFLDDMGDTTSDINNYFSYYLIVYKAGEPNGVARGYYKSGKLELETPFSNGKVNGVEKHYYENGQLEAEVPYTNYKINGVEKDYYENGKLSEVSPYIEGKHTGVTKLYDTNGVLGEEDTYKTDDDVLVKFFKHGILITELPLFKMRKNGVREDYYDNGTLKSVVTYINDTIEGVAKKYYQDGKIWSETNYNNGVKGITTTYDENGNEIK